MKSLDLTTEEGVTALMQSSSSEKDWNYKADKVRQANNNDYPNFWYKACILSGLVNRVSAGW